MDCRRRCYALLVPHTAARKEMFSVKKFNIQLIQVFPRDDREAYTQQTDMVVRAVTMLEAVTQLYAEYPHAPETIFKLTIEEGDM